MASETVAQIPKMEELDEKQKKEFEKLIKETNKKQEEFLKAYRDLVKKYNLDFTAIPIIISTNNTPLTGPRLDRITKTVKRALFQDKAELKATFKLTPRVAQEDGNTNT